jgi:hypothetical protein
MTERFRLAADERERLVNRLAVQGVKVSTVVDLLGCSERYVYKVLEKLKQGSEAPETGGKVCTTAERHPNVLGGSVVETAGV